MKTLFVGRFQPFHNGHLFVIKTYCDKVDTILIGLGSSQYSNSLENPFNEAERKKMIEESLKYHGIKNFEIISIPDIHNYPKWVDHVLSITSDFDEVISNSQLTKHLFNQKNIPVKETTNYAREKYSGSEIRRRIINDLEWKSLVPPPVFNIIMEIDGINRLKKLASKK
ncbi:MAG: nicotinamide-nucleotide adenylyltransferase [Candidatus Thermoplasmatota archaeon]|nr:nicotinamide-nucleotide adenylyltransferase [Candidatus Thermoplasmatota archaeon]